MLRTREPCGDRTSDTFLVQPTTSDDNLFTLTRDHADAFVVDDEHARRHAQPVDDFVTGVSEGFPSTLKQDRSELSPTVVRETDLDRVKSAGFSTA